MRLRFWRRRLTVSAPRMMVRSALPWPLRWLTGAIVLGFSAAVALWAFEFGKDIAGLDRNARDELERLRTEVVGLREELASRSAVDHTAESRLTIERALQDQLRVQIRQLEADNQSLRNDLGFFERLIPAGGDALAIRGLQAERLSDTQWRWQVLMMQAARNAPDFKGALEITFTGTLDGKPWALAQAPVLPPEVLPPGLHGFITSTIVPAAADAVREQRLARRRPARHAARQRRDREHPCRQQRQRHRHHQRQRDARGGHGHGAPGFAHHHLHEFAVVHQWPKAAHKVGSDFAVFGLPQHPRPKLGGHTQRPQQHQGQTQPKHPCGKSRITRRRHGARAADRQGRHGGGHVQCVA